MYVQRSKVRSKLLVTSFCFLVVTRVCGYSLEAFVYHQEHLVLHIKHLECRWDLRSCPNLNLVGRTELAQTSKIKERQTWPKDKNLEMSNSMKIKSTYPFRTKHKNW